MKNLKKLTILILFILLLNTAVYGIVAKDYDFYDFNEIKPANNSVSNTNTTKKNETTNIVKSDIDVPGKSAPEPSKVKIISKGMAYILKTLQILQYLLPVLFFVGMLIFNAVKEDRENNIINIVKYLIISVLIFFAIIGIGEMLLNKSESYGYSSKTIDYIKYNGREIYYHR